MSVPNLFAARTGRINLSELDADFAYLIGSPAFTGSPSVNKNNATSALTLTMPDSTDPIYDTQPIGGLHIASPPTPTTRNFLAGIWIETNAAAIDKGRAILINNYGHSDGIYVQQDGTSGTGEAILLTASATSATGLVIGTTLASQLALVLRQETGILPTANGILLTLQAEGALTEMVRIDSAAVAGQIGFVFRLYGAGAKPIVVKDSGGIDQYVLNNVGSVTSLGTLSYSGAGDNFVEGIIKQGATAQAANNAQVVTVGNVGPAGAGVAILAWRKTKDSAGNLRYIPLFG